jgi:hypothetical protein
MDNIQGRLHRLLNLNNQHQQPIPITATMSTPSTNAVSIKLPEFYIQNPELWFGLAEAQFHKAAITTEDTKYHHIVAALDEATALRVQDIIVAKPEVNPYTTLRERLCSVFELSLSERFARIFNFEPLGDRKPSLLFEGIRHLIPQGSDQNHLFLKFLFLKQIPEAIRVQLVNDPIETDRNMADFQAKADRIWQAMATHQVESEDIAASSARQRNGQPQSTLCWYHRRWGKDAQKCNKPCTWISKNADSGRTGRR